MKELFLHTVSTGQEVPVPFTPISEIEGVLGELGFDTSEPGYDDTNGWYIDFWYIYKLNGEKYQLSGSLYSGNFKFKKL